MAEVLVTCHYWPSNIEFTINDLYTVIEVLNKQNKTYV
jgi:hypothetical protein